MTGRRVGAAVAAVVVLACGGERGDSSGRARPNVEHVTIQVAAGRPAYAAGEPMPLTIAVRNPTTAAITLRFATSQRYDFVIESAGGAAVWRWSAGRSFVPRRGGQTVPPGWELNYSETFGGRLAPGRYRVRALVTAVDDALEAVTEVTVRP